MSDEIPGELRDFITYRIGSIAQLELLLLLRGEPEKLWNLEEAAKALYIGADMIGPLLAGLQTHGLIAIEANQTFGYAPQNETLARLVHELAELYAVRRLTVVNLIYSGPVQKIQSFADAFKITKPKGDG
jgi:hypothetical protein